MNDQHAITIDGTLDGVYDRIGFYLTQAGLEDASGARRFCFDALRQGEFDRIARYLKVDAKMVRKEFGHLQIFHGGTK